MSIVYILICILLFGFLIAIHEFGHFIVAKACGVRVNEFSVGMGPLLWHKEGEETKYSLRLLPIGGYCAMEGEDEQSEDPRAFGNAAAWKRFLILVAGAAFNFITGLVIVLCLYTGVERYVTPVIVGFAEGFPLQGEEALMEGDEIVAINGRRLLLNSDFTTILALANSDYVDVTVRRDGETLVQKNLNLIPREYTENGETTRRYGINFAMADAGALTRVKLGFYATIDFARQVFWSLEMLIQGTAGLKDLSGPVGIVNTMTEVGQSSPNLLAAAENILYFGAFVAVNLAVMNLLPLPALDGGRIFFLLLNALAMAVFRRSIPQKLEGAVHLAGLVLLLLLMGVVAVNDIYKIVT